MDERLIAYVYFFNNKQDYFECHEYGESLWLDTGHPVVLKGLIQAAVCLYHLENGNARGATSMWFRARNYLEPYYPIYEGIDICQLVRDLDHHFKQVPKEWYDKQVPADVVASLHLAPVLLRVTDPVLRQKVEAFAAQDTEER